MSNPDTINRKCLISRSVAAMLAPTLVAFIEGQNSLFDAVEAAQSSVKPRQKVVLCFKNWTKPKESIYAEVKVTSVRSDCIEAVDGPVIRVTDGLTSWRTDGADWIYPIK